MGVPLVAIWLATASADPRPVRSASADSVRAPRAFAWTAPATCPDAAAVRARVEQRLGAPLDGVHGLEIVVTKDRAGFVAQIDARAITVANDVRTLRSARCDRLADAVAMIVARLATEARSRHIEVRPTVAAPTIALATTMPSFPSAILSTASWRDDDFTPDPDAPRIAVATIVRPPTKKWGGGVHVLALSGVGALPQVNIGGEIAGHVRRFERFASLGISRWVPQDARLAPGAPGGVEVRLDIVTVRAGWGPQHKPLRAWLLGELGRLAGTGMGLDAERTGTARWSALGAGMGVGWPMSDHARLVGTFEIAVPLERPRFMLAQGSDLYQPGALAARCALGLEVGWP